MPQTRINCPNCRQPILADVEQLFDVASDPAAKQRLLSGAVNVAQCNQCGYRGNLSTPIVYHDPQKELLLTYFPSEMGLKRDDQERLIGQLINQVVSRLPQELRKGYLLRPQSVLTYQGLVERILEEDGITREMIQAQQQRMNLLQKLLAATDDVQVEIARQEDHLIDNDFFALMNRLIEAAVAANDRQAAQKLADVQKNLVKSTTFGRKLEEQTREVQAAMESLQMEKEGLTREKLLDLVIEAPNDTRLSALVSLARPGMDYTFFQLMSERIDRARGDGRARLIQLRERVLELTRQIDQQMEARAQQSRQLLHSILDASDIDQAATQSLPAMDEFFLQELDSLVENARKNGDLEQLARLQKVVDVVKQASAPPPEVAFIEQLIEAPNEEARQSLISANAEAITPEFLDTLTSISTQVDSSEDQELAARVRDVYRSVVRYSMKAKMNTGG